MSVAIIAVWSHPRGSLLASVFSPGIASAMALIDTGIGAVIVVLPSTGFTAGDEDPRPSQEKRSREDTEKQCETVR